MIERREGAAHHAFPRDRSSAFEIAAIGLLIISRPQFFLLKIEKTATRAKCSSGTLNFFGGGIDNGRSISVKEQSNIAE
jgi:hypothetical protein